MVDSANTNKDYDLAGNFIEEEPDPILSQGLDVLGWQLDVRLTTENMAQLRDICKEAIDYNNNGSLTPAKADDLALQSYNIIKHQLFDVEGRADAVSTWYINSTHLKPLITMIDEATMSFYRGYDLAALSILFVIVERYLRSLRKNDSDRITFKELIELALLLENEKYALKAYKTLSVIYSRFYKMNPTQFYFNRHGLLHGLRGQTQYDQMNCARLFLLLDTFCMAENVDKTAWGENLEMHRMRVKIYAACRENTIEQRLLSIKY